MNALRRKVGRAEAETLLASWKGSGVSLPRWCALRGVDGRSMRYWADHLPSGSPTIRVVELAPRTTLPVAASLRVTVEGVVVDVPDGFTEATLAAVLRAVRGC